MIYELNENRGIEFSMTLLETLLNARPDVYIGSEQLNSLVNAADALRIGGFDEDALFIYLTQSVFAYASDASEEDAMQYATILLNGVSQVPNIDKHLEIVRLFIKSKKDHFDPVVMRGHFVDVIKKIPDIEDGVIKTAYMSTIRVAAMSPHMISSDEGRSILRAMIDYLKTRGEVELQLASSVLSLGVFVK